MPKLTLTDTPSLPSCCDGLPLTFEFDYIAPMLGGWDHPNINEGVVINSISCGDDDFTWLLDGHKKRLEAVVLDAYKRSVEDELDFTF